MSRLVSCSRDFPNECRGCPEYVEEPEGLRGLEEAVMGGFGFFSGPSYTVKRCKRFNWKAYDRISSNNR